MRIKKFIAPSMQEGKSRVFRELGDDAVILSTRNVKDPANPNVELVEIIAALDTPAIRKEGNANISTGSKDSGDINSRIETQTSQFIQATSQIYNEIYRLKEILFDIQDSVKYKYSGILGEILGNLFRNLRKFDFSEEFALNIVSKLNGMNEQNYDSVKAKCIELITKEIALAPAINKKRSRQIFAFIGPTGSGKTTTLEKLAIISKLVLNSNIMIISTDTQKIGGFEQLQTFSSIASIPFRAVYSPEELVKILSQETDKDFIFIDTTGRNPKLFEHLNEISDYLESCEVDHTFLVVNSNLNKSSLKNIITLYGKLGFSSVILSKADEAHTLGEFAEILYENNFPLSYITTGQQVPDDIEPATKENVIKLVFGDKL